MVYLYCSNVFLGMDVLRRNFKSTHLFVERKSIGIYDFVSGKCFKNLPHPSTLHIAVLQALEEVLHRI